GGAVTLSGRVALYMGRQQAAVLASLVRGVARVDNRIKVDPSIPTVRGMRSSRPVITGRT
ncbi:MAG TPA: BON domain-containing protein, partial [Candidatus Polarisedimenticolia bacterium]|nr:BON domain-containing protein [Candidatus Polarisedimenticolia bacterium]